jgi:hypothetical protein
MSTVFQPGTFKPGTFLDGFAEAWLAIMALMIAFWKVWSMIFSSKTYIRAKYMKVLLSIVVSGWYGLGVQPLTVLLEDDRLLIRQVDGLALSHPFWFGGVLEELRASAHEVLVNIDNLVAGLNTDILPREAVAVSSQKGEG